MNSLRPIGSHHLREYVVETRILQAVFEEYQGDMIIFVGVRLIFFATLFGMSSSYQLISPWVQNGFGMNMGWINPWRHYECVLWSNNPNPLVCLKEPARCYVVCFFQRYRTTPWKISTNNGGQMIFLFQGVTFRFHGWRMSYTESCDCRGIPLHWTTIWKLRGCDFDCLALTQKNPVIEGLQWRSQGK